MSRYQVSPTAAADHGARSSIIELQQRLRGAMRKAFLLIGGQVTPFEEFHCGEVVLERVVDREHEIVETQHRAGAIEHRHVENPTAGDEYVVTQVIADVVAHQRLRGPGCRQPTGHRQSGIEPGEAERQQFAHVSDDDLQIRMAVEHPGADQPQQMRAGFHRPAPGGHQRRVERRVVRVGNRRRRIGRMNVDRNTQRLGPPEQHVERRVIEVAPVGVSVDQRAFEAELVNRPLQLVGGVSRRLGGQHGKAREPGWLGGNDFGQPVVDFAADRDRQLGLVVGKHLHSRLNV